MLQVGGEAQAGMLCSSLHPFKTTLTCEASHLHPVNLGIPLLASLICDRFWATKAAWSYAEHMNERFQHTDQVRWPLFPFQGVKERRLRSVDEGMQRCFRVRPGG
jgi:hypothetical protein